MAEIAEPIISLFLPRPILPAAQIHPELQVLFGKDLRGFTPCPEVARGNCRAPEITLDAAR